MPNCYEMNILKGIVKHFDKQQISLMAPGTLVITVGLPGNQMRHRTDVLMDEPLYVAVWEWILNGVSELCRESG